MIEHKGIKMYWMMVSPATAKTFMASNATNRRLDIRTVDSYARDMAAGRWPPCPDAVCFLPNGALGNGQHRLSAIIKSGADVELLIATNVPEESIAAMDRGRKRTATDFAHFIGDDASARDFSIARIVEFGRSDISNVRVRTYDELIDAVNKHRDAINFVLSYSKGKKRGFNAVVLAVVARAFYTRQTSRLQEFLSVLESGLCESAADSAAITLRDFLHSVKNNRGNSLGRLVYYDKTQSALRSFLDFRPMSKVYGTSDDLFPVPVSRT